MMAKSMKSLDLHYPMIQFLKIAALHKETIKKIEQQHTGV